MKDSSLGTGLRNSPDIHTYDPLTVRRQLAEPSAMAAEPMCAKHRSHG